MGKMKLMCVAIMLLGSVPLASAGRGHGHHGHHNHGHHNHGHHHHRHGGGYGGAGLALGMGLLGYGLGYYGSRAAYYPPSYGYGNRYGYPPVGYAPNYGYAQPYGYAPAVVAPPAASVYIQQQQVVQTQSQGQAANYWHYCRNPEGYYPYVKKCPEGWLQVAPEPAQ